MDFLSHLPQASLNQYPAKQKKKRHDMNLPNLLILFIPASCSPPVLCMVMVWLIVVRSIATYNVPPKYLLCLLSLYQFIQFLSVTHAHQSHPSFPLLPFPLLPSSFSPSCFLSFPFLSFLSFLSFPFLFFPFLSFLVLVLFLLNYTIHYFILG